MEALIGGRPRTSWLTAIVGPRRHIVRRHRRVMSGRRKATVLLKLGSSSGSGVSRLLPNRFSVRCTRYLEKERRANALYFALEDRGLMHDMKKTSRGHKPKLQAQEESEPGAYPVSHQGIAHHQPERKSHPTPERPYNLCSSERQQPSYDGWLLW